MRERIRAGDQAAFEALFDEHAQAVYRYAVRVCGDPAVAEDIMSLTFLEAWRIRRRVHAEGDGLLPWLLGIATNVHRNQSRAARRHREAMDRLPSAGAAPDFSAEVVARLSDAEELRAVRAALGRLRRLDREVFALCVWSGLDHAAAAEALGVPVQTVRTRLSRARARLRELTAEEMRALRPATDPSQRSTGRPNPAWSTQEASR